MKMRIMNPFPRATNVHGQKMNPFCDIECAEGYSKCCQKERQNIYTHIFLYPSAITVKPDTLEADKSGQISSFFFLLYNDE